AVESGRAGVSLYALRGNGITFRKIKGARGQLQISTWGELYGAHTDETHPCAVSIGGSGRSWAGRTAIAHRPGQDRPPSTTGVCPGHTGDQRRSRQTGLRSRHEGARRV